MDVQAKVFDTIAEILGTHVENISVTSKLREDFGADSLDLTELTIALENEFDIDIPDKDAAGMLLVGDIVQYIRGKADANH